jgi:hypothetical protein
MRLAFKKRGTSIIWRIYALQKWEPPINKTGTLYELTYRCHTQMRSTSKEIGYFNDLTFTLRSIFAADTSGDNELTDIPGCLALSLFPKFQITEKPCHAEWRTLILEVLGSTSTEFVYLFLCAFVSCSVGWLVTYEGVSKSFRTARLARELQVVQISAISCSCIAILWVSLVSSAAITLCVAS